MQNNERYLAFSPAVSQAFLEVSDLRGQFFSVRLYYMLTLSMLDIYCVRRYNETVFVFATFCTIMSTLHLVGGPTGF